jgi:N6-adenosine-specific RNA methylase IME4
MPEGLTDIVAESCEAWEAEGFDLGKRERSAEALMWDVGDWWLKGDRYEDRAQRAGRPGMPTLGTCYVAGSIARRWSLLMRIKALSWHHHQIAAPVKDDVQARALLMWCLETDPPRGPEQLRAEMKRRKRAARERALADATIAASVALGSKLYGVIHADPPWRFEPYSRATGLDRAADNHYQTMAVDDICALTVPAADDCVVFLWATVPMLPEALRVLDAWGFSYRSHFVWLKDRIGTGYWNRNQHELLLIGTRGDIPAPAPGEQFASVIEATVGAHSAKPAAFAEMIEEMFPHAALLEMFARAPRLGWDSWGNEAAREAAA